MEVDQFVGVCTGGGAMKMTKTIWKFDNETTPKNISRKPKEKSGESNKSLTGGENENERKRESSIQGSFLPFIFFLFFLSLFPFLSRFFHSLNYFFTLVSFFPFVSDFFVHFKVYSRIVCNKESDRVHIPAIPTISSFMHSVCTCHC